MLSLQEASTIIVVEIILATGRLGRGSLFSALGSLFYYFGKLAMMGHLLKSVGLG